MFLSRLTLAEGATGQSELWRSFASPYALHQAVWRLFPHAAGQPRDFLYRLDTVAGRPQIWTLSPQPPQASPLWRREVKKLDPHLESGDRLEIEVRVNPVVSTWKPENRHEPASSQPARGKRKRHDVVMDLKRRLRWKEKPPEERESEIELVQRAASDWLAARAEKAGLKILSLRAEGYRQDRFPRPGQAAGVKVELGICDLQGIVEVEQPEAFLATWRQGLGPAKGFGCGLILMRRIRP
jgi:CRISPR system Cascade subunit CasE